jgi:hypothetical protein
MGEDKKNGPHAEAQREGLLKQKATGNSVSPLIQNINTIDIEAVSERAAIIEFDGNASRYYAERTAADLYRLTREQREAIFPMPRLIGYEAVLFMAKLGFRFMPVIKKKRQTCTGF